MSEFTVTVFSFWEVKTYEGLPNPEGFRAKTLACFHESGLWMIRAIEVSPFDKFKVIHQRPRWEPISEALVPQKYKLMALVLR